jgi:hypothetical protein
MSGARLFATLTLLIGLAAPLGCCERKGYIVRCDMALELNRVSHLLGRHDDYEACPGDCDCAECQAMDGWSGDGGGGMSGADPRLHPVPTRPVFAPASPTPAAPRETIDPNAPPLSQRPSGDFRARNVSVGRTTPRESSRQLSRRDAAAQAMFAKPQRNTSRPR